MVIIKLMGGLGNQMFQYAAGRRLAYRLKAQLKLDVHGFEHDPLRKYGLHCLNIQEVFATTTEISMFFALKKPQNFSNMFSRFLGMTSSYVVIRENLFLSFSPEVLTATGNIYLDGYWQSEKYFADIAPLIKQEFTITSPLTKKNQEMLDKIHNTDSIGVHIRRGDYVTNPLTNQIHGTCSREYYIDSINLISKRVPHPYYFVFSDDSQWVKENILFPHDPVTYVTHNSVEQAHEDLRLLTHCKHFVIANSSFSWWGAWLSEHPNKIVLAPRRWLNDPAYDRKDLIPQGWEKF